MVRHGRPSPHPAILFVAVRLIGSVVKPGDLAPASASLSHTACWLGLLLIALALHELGHAVAAAWLEGEQDEVHLWPLGNLVGPSFKMRSGEHYWSRWPAPSPAGRSSWRRPAA